MYFAKPFKVTIVIIASILFIYWIYSKNSNSTKIEQAYLNHSVEQNSNERNWIEVSLELLSTNTEFWDSSFLKAGKGDFFYVSDGIDLLIKKIDLAGNVVQIFGKGKGRGPGEFITLNSLYIDENDRIWVGDPSNGRITIFNQDGSWDIIHNEDIPMRVLPLNNDLYVVEPRFDSQLRFKDLAGQTIRYTKPLLVDEGPLWAYIFFSEFARDGDNGIIRSFHYTNEFVRYTEEGEIVYFRQPINPPDLSKLKILPPKRYEENQQVWFNELAHTSYLQVQQTRQVRISNNKIHLLISHVQNEERFSNFVDVYDWLTGDYLYSYKLPKSVTTFDITENYIAGILQDSVALAIWEIKGGW